MFDLEKDGFLILDSVVNSDEIEKLELFAKQQFFNENRIEPKIINLEEIHHVTCIDKVKYLSMSYGGLDIENEIERIAHRINNKLKQLFNKSFSTCKGSSLIANFPKNLSGYKVGYHQDDFFDSNNHRYHVLVPFNKNGSQLFNVIPKTHNTMTFKHTSFGPLLRINDDRLNAYLPDNISLSLKQGDAVIFKTSLVHKLEDNQSDLTNWFFRFHCV